MNSRGITIIGAVSLFLASSGMAAADGHGKSTGGSGPSLQEQAQNPITSLISVPFQSNFNFGTGMLDRMQYVMNVQPVYPATLSDDWNLIIRPIVPIINKPKMFAGDTSEFGLGDIIPACTDQNPWAHSRMPMDVIFHGRSMSLFQALQQSATIYEHPGSRSRTLPSLGAPREGASRKCDTMIGVAGSIPEGARKSGIAE